MDRKRVLAIVAAAVVLVILALVGVTIARAWPMISGEKVVVGPKIDDPEWERSLPGPSEIAEAPSTEVPERPAISPADAAGKPLLRTAAYSDADLILGLWVCVEGNASQAKDSAYYFRPPEEGTTGSLYVTEDYYAEEPDWVEAAYQLGLDGRLTISPVSFGMWALSSSYAVEFDQVEGHDVMYMWSLDPGDENDAEATLVKVPDKDSEWESFDPEPADPEVFAEPTADQLDLATEITNTLYPLFQVENVLVQEGDPDDRWYAGDSLVVEASLKVNPDVRIALTHYVAAGGSPAPTWVESEYMPSAYKSGTATDGTRYAWDYVSLSTLQNDSLDPVITALLEQLSADFPGCVILVLDPQDEWANPVVTRWEAYPTWWETGFFELSYQRTDTSWELYAFSGPYGE